MRSKIHRDLKRNRDILHELAPSGKRKVKREMLQRAGFDWHFHTHRIPTRGDRAYQFCYDYGVLELGEGMCLIVQNKISA
ncbi:hypothetical protein [Pontibacter sp. G13]|uniref:hypothetical protein n=1 Tax=Pontibacter sp. G13 TaxID=3074898 RepID=UPI00288C3607|nr:hypothetical protein [Pontibacter sp. G13]WNJ18243.1 hypothetical protein RJD25_25610 [Pontibacter sp. G13]